MRRAPGFGSRPRRGERRGRARFCRRARGRSGAVARLDLSPSGDLVEAASNLFAYLRALDESGARTMPRLPFLTAASALRSTTGSGGRHRPRRPEGRGPANSFLKERLRNCEREQGASDGLQPTATAMNAELSWDEFRLVKAISNSRSLAGAAELLGLNHSTVFRRLAALETSIGARLFERSRSGYRPTAAGDEMIALATKMANSIVEFERRVAGRDAKPTGQLRVTTVEAIGQHLLPAIMAQFQIQNPGVVIELILSNQRPQPFAPRRRRRHPADQRSARNAGRPSDLRGSVGDIRPSRPCFRTRIEDNRCRAVHWFLRKFRASGGATMDRDENPIWAHCGKDKFDSHDARTGDARLRGGAPALLSRRFAPRADSDRTAAERRRRRVVDSDPFRSSTFCSCPSVHGLCRGRIDEATARDRRRRKRRASVGCAVQDDARGLQAVEDKLVNRKRVGLCNKGSRARLENQAPDRL